jgi:two-component system, cell cycle sensor histidine kinase and response regulator CckA
MKTAQKWGLSHGTESILVVDDDRAILHLCKILLESLGYNATVEDCPRAALDRFARRPYKYDLVITDYEMGPFNGGKLASAMSRIRPDIPIIAYTGNPASAYHSANFRDVMVKPSSVKDIAATIRQVLDYAPAPVSNASLQDGL